MSKPGETQFGKGSFPRTWNTEQFRDNYDTIFRNPPILPICTNPKRPHLVGAAAFTLHLAEDVWCDNNS